MKVDSFLTRLKSTKHYAGQIVHAEKLPERKARFGMLTPALPERIKQILSKEGIEKLYTHQVQSIDNVRKGNDVVVVTGTASGKTICYNAPVLEKILKEPDACALYLYPTKALAQDQLRTLHRYQNADPSLPLRTGFVL